MKKIIKSSQKKSHQLLPQEYIKTLAELKKRILDAQIKTTLAVNKELVKLYWSIGRTIVEKQKKSAWGSSTIEKLSLDLQKLFPGIAGFSRTNIFRMRSFYAAYQDFSDLIVPEAPGQLEDLPFFNIPWWHNATLLEKLKDNKQRLWYAQKSIEYGWSNSILEMHIKSKLYNREGKAITNFKKTLPSPHSDMAQQSFKDPYLFDFLTLSKEHGEQEIEQGLIDNIQKLLLELGKGFAFIGRQYHVQVSDTDYYFDLLFYHIKLRCYVVVELKARKFDPRDAGQLNFYLSVVDNQLRSKDDKPTIGILLCKTKDKLIAEYALQGIDRSIGVADYETEIIKKLPKKLEKSLPTIEEIEAELTKQEFLKKERMKMRKRKNTKNLQD